MRRGALFAAALLLLAFPAGGAAQLARPLFEFGRVGGNIVPFTVEIRTDGTLAHSGPVQFANPNARLTRARLAALLRLARAQRFWSLPRRTTCSGVLPDIASFFVTISSGGKTRTVTVHGDCLPRFERIYRALAAAATVRS